MSQGNAEIVARAYAHFRETGEFLPELVHLDMRFVQLITVRDGQQIRVDMYDDPGEALAAAGLLE